MNILSTLLFYLLWFISGALFLVILWQLHAFIFTSWALYLIRTYPASEIYQPSTVLRSARQFAYLIFGVAWIVLFFASEPYLRKRFIINGSIRILSILKFLLIQIIIVALLFGLNELLFE